VIDHIITKYGHDGHVSRARHQKGDMITSSWFPHFPQKRASPMTYVRYTHKQGELSPRVTLEKLVDPRRILGHLLFYMPMLEYSGHADWADCFLDIFTESTESQGVERFGLWRSLQEGKREVALGKRALQLFFSFFTLTDMDWLANLWLRLLYSKMTSGTCMHHFWV
jgi:hypothetical protein